MSPSLVSSNQLGSTSFSFPLPSFPAIVPILFSLKNHDTTHAPTISSVYFSTYPGVLFSFQLFLALHHSMKHNKGLNSMYNNRKLTATHRQELILVIFVTLSSFIDITRVFIFVVSKKCSRPEEFSLWFLKTLPFNRWKTV